METPVRCPTLRGACTSRHSCRSALPTQPVIRAVIARVPIRRRGETRREEVGTRISVNRKTVDTVVITILASSSPALASAKTPSKPPPLAAVAAADDDDMAAATSSAKVAPSEANDDDDGGLGVVRIKPLGAGGGGGEASAEEGGVEPVVTPTATGGVRVGAKTFGYPTHVIEAATDQEQLYATFMPRRVEAFLAGTKRDKLKRDHQCR